MDNNKYKVKYRNDLNLVPLRRFNAKEMDLFFALCSRMRDKELEEVRFTFEQLKHLSDYKMTATKAFVKDLQSLYKNMLQLTYKREDDEKIEYFVLFTGFEINKKDKYVDISVNPKLAYIINNINKEFTAFELAKFTTLKSSYSKTLYRLLMQFRNAHSFIIKVSDFREVFDVPKSYQMTHIDRKILKPAIEELSIYFDYLTLEKVKEKGKNKIDRFVFRFKEKQDLPTIPMHNWLEGI